MSFIVGAGAYAGCAYCCIRGEYSKVLQKMVYLQHRAFLPAIDHLRTTHRNFPSKTVPAHPPTLKTMEFITKKITDLSEQMTNRERKEKVQSSGCTGDYSLRRLPNHDRFINTPVEPMYLIKNISERIVKLLSGKTDTVKVRVDEKERKRFRSSWVKNSQEGGKTFIPPAPFTISSNELSIANQHSLNVKAPAGVDWRPLKIFGKDSSRLKSNQWKHLLTSGILKFCIRDLLGRDQEATLTELCDVVSLLCAEEVKLDNMDGLEYRVHRVLSLMERDFPACVPVITLHLLHHLPAFIRRFGPMYEFWMYPMERFNNWIKNRVLNRRHPEATVLETYRLYELSFHLQLTNQLPIGATVDISAYADDSSSTSDDIHETDQQSGLHNHGSSSILTPKHIEELRRMYTCTYPELTITVEPEPQNSDRPEDFSDGATSSHCIALPKEVTVYKVYTLKDQHNRSVRFGSILSEHENSVHISSYVCLNKTSNFGRIQFIFEHNFNSNTQTFVCVHWYDSATTCQTSGLKYVNVETQNTSLPDIAYLKDVSKPLVHAKDDIDPNKLWILNYQ